MPRSLAFVALAAIAGSSLSRAQQPPPVDTALVDSIIRHHVAEKRTPDGKLEEFLFSRN